MAVTVTCECGWTTDLELHSETNPKHCPKCGGAIVLDGTDEPLYVAGEYNPVLHEGQGEE